MSYEFILVDAQVAPFVAKIQLNRPKELNALNLQLMGEIRDALLMLDADDSVRAIVITGCWFSVCWSYLVKTNKPFCHKFLRYHICSTPSYVYYV